ncbi:MAG: phospho-N-acetylmuramoyl-pentapeptide-transferase [Rikenellaceae bacterium]
MIKYIAHFLGDTYDLPGMGMFDYLSFRAAITIITALLIGTLFGRKLINFLQRKQIGEGIRDLGLEGQMAKKGTPTMGGIIILISIIIPVLLFCDLSNIYIQLMIISTIWLGAIGFADDYIKVFKKDKGGLNGKFKIVGQVGLGIIIGLTMWHSEKIVVRDTKFSPAITITTANNETNHPNITLADHKNTLTTIPFLKSNEFDYHSILPSEDKNDNLGWIIYVIAAVFIITAVSNGANLTDGLDGLAAGTSAIIGTVLAILAYISGHIIYANYLNIMYIPGSGELFVYCAAFIGAMIGFLWYNSYPAQVFMGDTGSLAIGGIIAVVALLIRKELLLPILCGIFLVEAVSVMLQVSYFKYTRMKFGEGRRIFLMAPLHHHFQTCVFPEVKIVTRFWIIQLLLAAITLATFKVR